MNGPLSGMRVVGFAVIGLAPFFGRLLTDGGVTSAEIAAFETAGELSSD